MRPQMPYASILLASFLLVSGVVFSSAGHGQEIKAKPGDTIEVEYQGKTARVSVGPRRDQPEILGVVVLEAQRKGGENHG